MKQEFRRWTREGFLPSIPGPRELAAVQEDPVLRQARSLLLLPPLWDHHGHLAWLGAIGEEVDLRGTASPEEALERVREFALGLPAGVWVVGFGWDQNAWGGALPPPGALAAACPGRPAYLRRIDTHAAWVNAAALGPLGLSPGGADPPGGAYLRSAGVFVDIVLDRAMEPFEALLAKLSAGRARDRIRTGLEQLRAAGLCGTTDMNLDSPGAAALAELDREGALPLPVDGFLAPAAVVAAPVPSAPGSRFRILGRKVFMDGALGSRGAALEEDYCDDPGNRGLLVETAEGVRTHLEEARAGRYTVAVHAIGDRALGVLLDAAEAFGANPPLRLEHLQVVPERHLVRLGRLAPVVSLQPCHLLSDAPWAPERLGRRMDSAYRLRTLDGCGRSLLLGTDYPIEPPDPRRTLYACLTRGPQEGLSLGRALKGMAPPEGAVGSGAFTVAAGEPWEPGRDARAVLEWELRCIAPEAGGGP